MPVFSRIKNWVSNEVLTAADLNAEINNLLNNTIPASIEDYSADVSTMQTTADPGGVGTESLATSLAGELTRIRFAIKRIVGGAQWYSAPDFDLTGVLARTNLPAVGQQVSSSSGSFQLTGGTKTDVTNLSVTITTSGRPVRVEVQHDGSANAMSLVATRSNISFSIEAYIVRDSTNVYIEGFSHRGDTLTFIQGNYRPPAITDVVAAGTYTYKVQLKNVVSTNSATVNMDYCKLVAYEL